MKLLWQTVYCKNELWNENFHKFLVYASSRRLAIWFSRWESIILHDNEVNELRERLRSLSICNSMYKRASWHTRSTKIARAKMLTKNKQVKLNRRCLLIYNLPVVVLFTTLKSATFKIKQTPLFITQRQILDWQTDPLQQVQNRNIVQHEAHLHWLQQKITRSTNKIV
jgi:hypothetical protein